MKAYKAFKKDLTCRGFQYAEGETYTLEGSPVICEHGYHFCKYIAQTLEYYPVININENAYAEVDILGDIVWDELEFKGCTNKLKIVKVFSDEEILAIFDQNQNTGDWNTGHQNTGHRNTGHQNTGHRNTGHQNTGDWNTGHRNTGDWNTTNRETGFFNTVQSPIINVFNKPCLLSVWGEADKPNFLWFDLEPELTYKECFQKSFANASEHDVILLKALPNFDKDVFFEISGIMIN